MDNNYGQAPRMFMPSKTIFVYVFKMTQKLMYTILDEFYVYFNFSSFFPFPFIFSYVFFPFSSLWRISSINYLHLWTYLCLFLISFVLINLLFLISSFYTCLPFLFISPSSIYISPFYIFLPFVVINDKRFYRILNTSLYWPCVLAR